MTKLNENEKTLTNNVTHCQAHAKAGQSVIYQATLSGCQSQVTVRISLNSQRAPSGHVRDAMITSLLCQNDVATSF